MDTALYVNQIGSLVNDSTKYTVNIDESAVTNVSLIAHLNSVLEQLPEKWELFPEEFKEKWMVEGITKKINSYIHCMKKEMNFYTTKVETENCILTELDGNIKLETV